MFFLLLTISLMVRNPLWDVTDMLSIMYACYAAHLGRRGVIMFHMQRELMNSALAQPALQGLSPIQQFTLRMDVR